MPSASLGAATRGRRFRMAAVPADLFSPYEVSADRPRFLFFQPTTQDSPPLTVVINRQTRLKK